MAELTVADLEPFPYRYQSSRSKFDVLIGEDTAMSLMEASSSGDDTALRTMLSQPQWTKIMFGKPHCIYMEDRPSQNESDVRRVTAMPVSNLERAIIKAAENGHAAAVSALLTFASQQGVDPLSFITYWAVNRTIINGHAAVFEAMASAAPKVISFPLGHGRLPISEAAKRKQTEIVAVLLRHGALKGRRASQKETGGYRSSLLSLAAAAKGTRMTELLLQHGVPVARSGALHLAAELGALDTIRPLIQHGADVDERLPEDRLPNHHRALRATWTPMHFAASGGQIDAMKLLESKGARCDVKDENGRTAAEVLRNALISKSQRSWKACPVQ